MKSKFIIEFTVDEGNIENEINEFIDFIMKNGYFTEYNIYRKDLKEND